QAPPPCPGVPGAHLSELGWALLHYLSFCQRGSFSRLARLQRERAALPIARYRSELVALVAQHQVLVVAGDTGCGKSTQVPQYLLGAGYGQVCCAQPRRVACAALARRVGLETLGRYQVGFQTRFERTCARGAHLVFVTLGLLLRQVQSDPTLARYQVLVADEVHERHLPGDLLLGALRRLLPARPTLRLLLMSATCDPHLFARYFGGAPVLQVPGRLHPIKVLYQPIPSEPGQPHLDAGPYLRVLEAIDGRVPPEERGDVLVFLSGAAEIQQVLGPAQVYARHTQRWVVLPLHSGLPAEQQDKVRLGGVTGVFGGPCTAAHLPSSRTSRYLQDQGALDEHENLTPIGHLLAHLPVDVVVGKVLVLGSLLHLSEPTLTVAAALSVPSPFLRPAHAGHTWADARRHLESPHGDPLTLLNLFNQWLQVKAERHGSSRQWCRRRGVAEHRLYEIADLRRQFQELLQEHELLEEGSGRSERRRGGRRERHLLSHAQRAGERRPRVLRLHLNEEDEEEEEEEDTWEKGGVDIRDVRFQLRHDPRELRLTCGAHLAPPQVALLGLVLARGLYPQLALPDPLNGSRRDSEQVFHTRAQQGVALHPTAVFASRPDLLQPQGGPGELSPDHQLVAFVSLLETTRPYLLTCLRVPALQVLLLCSRSLDTCGRRVVADGWLEVTCEDAQVSQRLLGVAVHLRLTWDRLLERLLSGGGDRPRPTEVSQLTWGLLEFLDEQVPYQLRQLTPLQRQHLYVGPHLGPAPSPHLQRLFPGTHLEPDQVKGGTKVTEFLTWGCLASEPDLFGPCLRRFWTCPRCDLHLPLTGPERRHHQDTCGAPEGTYGAPEGTGGSPEGTCAEDTCARDTCAEGTWSPPGGAPEGTWSPPEDTCAKDTCAEGTWSPPGGAPEGTWSPPEDTCAKDTCASPEGTWSPPEDTCARDTCAEGTWSPPEGTCARDTCASHEGTWSPPEGTCGSPENTCPKDTCARDTCASPMRAPGAHLR
ncbi:probable ATP-dependent RNA helicase DHX34, partial [Neopelma chrysocephalum]|uniref:probable ATP-dependent RNA helicase DHX34 n=1 Tax=Neopelma chrysocephalum TaxID=114329 RepID=UPI000FCD3FBA